MRENLPQSNAGVIRGAVPPPSIFHRGLFSCKDSLSEGHALDAPRISIHGSFDCFVA